VSETRVAAEDSSSRRTVTIAAVLFLLVLLPVQSQTPSPSETPIRGTTRRNVVPTTPSDRGNPARFTVPRQPTPIVTPSPSSIAQITEIIRLAKTARLEVSPTPPVDVNQEVTFTVVSKLPRAVEYRFNFSEATPTEWIQKPWTTHAYSSPGEYQASSEIALGGRKLDVPRISGPWVQVVQRSNPTPSATAARITPSPPSYTPSATASATASVPSSPSPYSPSPTATVLDGSITASPLPSTNNFASPTATSSPPEQYTPTPTPVPPDGGSASQRGWWVFYIVSAGLAAAALYVIPKLIKPTFHPHADWHEPQKSPKNLAINYGLYFHSNLSAGQDRLQTDGATLILRRRT
jgi:hypothetical protein